jgi:hypothetical protein
MYTDTLEKIFPPLIQYATEFTLSNDRLIYTPFYLTIEQYCRNQNVVVGGTIGFNMILSHSYNKDLITYDLYTNDIWRHAKALADHLYLTETSLVDKKTITVETVLKHEEIIIYVNTRLLVKLINMSNIFNKPMIEIIKPINRKGLFITEEVLCMPVEVYLMDIYRRCYTPYYPGPATNISYSVLVDQEKKLFARVKDLIKERFIKYVIEEPHAVQRPVDGGAADVNADNLHDIPHHLETSGNDTVEDFDDGDAGNASTANTDDDQDESIIGSALVIDGGNEVLSAYWLDDATDIVDGGRRHRDHHHKHDNRHDHKHDTRHDNKHDTRHDHKHKHEDRHEDRHDHKHKHDHSDKRLSTIDIFEALTNSDLSDNIIWVGDIAISKLIEDSDDSDTPIKQQHRPQIITDLAPDEILKQLPTEDSSGLPIKYSYSTYDLRIPDDFQIKKYIIYYTDDSRRISVLDIYNNTTYELIPFVAINGVNYALYWVLMRFRMLDLWTLRFILYIDKTIKLAKRLEYLTTSISVIRNKLYTKDPLELFPSDPSSYQGIYADRELLKRKQVGEDRFKYKKYYPFITYTTGN